ncbi:hypothetical protein FRB91_002870 [Serendipita sp. 411]|nr:hypothetical protein FRB91_002870 [Serendipita sp. 411]
MADPVYTPLSQVDDASRYGPHSSRGPDYYNRNHYQAPRRSNSSSDDEEEEDETKYPTIDHDEEELAGLHDTEDTRPTVLRYFIWALERGRPLVWNQWKLSPDAKFILFQTDRVKGWRHSSFGNYYVHDLEHGTTKPLVTPSDPPVVTYATWAPTRNAVAFVSDNDLYVVPSPGNDPVRITEGGNSTIFHAIPDWVYEEEVYSSNFALWWSSKGSKVSFLRFDETDVNDFTYPIYNPTDDADTVVPYPRQVTMKYPKPGYNNPLVTVHLFDLDGYLEAAGGANAKGHTWQLSWDDQRPETDSIIQEVAWINDDTLIIKEVNRSGDAGGVILFDTSHPTHKGKVVRRLGKEGEEGDAGWIDSSQRIYPLSEDSGRATAYLDVIPNKEGFNHIALFSPTDSKTPIWLTKGSWETSDRFQMPSIVRSTIMSDGYELNTMEIRPPSMDETGRTKYAVLFRVYGGPASQMVSLQWDRDWHHYLACSMKYIVVVVDGRGTGFKGRKLRNPVRNNLGEHEVQDQINAAKHWKSKRYVDSRRIGIWGWSYGGFMSSKVVEANAGVHSLAMAVAPVTSWRLYDSVYTERYMGTPQNNPEGYVNASVAKVEGFKHVDFLLAHGSGDDNVHFANSAHLLDMFTTAQIRRFRFRMFTDSDHGIQRRGAYRELYEWMLAFLQEKWGKGGYTRGW